jgi:hypothetical protein
VFVESAAVVGFIPTSIFSITDGSRSRDRLANITDRLAGLS